MPIHTWFVTVLWRVREGVGVISQKWRFRVDWLGWAIRLSAFWVVCVTCEAHSLPLSFVVYARQPIIHDLNIYSFDCGTVDANRRGCINTMPRPETPGFPSKMYLPSNTNTFPIPAPSWLRYFQGFSRQYHNYYRLTLLKCYQMIAHTIQRLRKHWREGDSGHVLRWLHIPTAEVSWCTLHQWYLF